MNEVMEKTNKLKEELECSDLIKKIKRTKKKALTDPRLFPLLKKYEEEKDEETKKEILKDPLFKEYKEQETELNLFIMQMNQELKKIKSKEGCSHENH